MHEFSLVESILECVSRVARENGDLPVERVDLEIGALQQVVPEALQMAFEAAKEGTPAAAAALTWILTPVMVTCFQCHAPYAPSEPPWICPQCGATGGRVVQGDELVVKSVVLSGGPAPQEKEFRT